MTEENEFEYDVALSFTQEDESIVTELNDLIQDRYRTFLYSKQQELLVGTDGESTFNEVFGQKARIVVIFYREKWGNTPWTRIEQTAIRNRAHDDGFDFTIFVQLDRQSSIPRWVPKNRIYFDYDRWGIKGLAAIVEKRVQENGGSKSVETLENHTKRQRRLIQLHKEREGYIASEQALQDAKLNFKNLCEFIENETAKLEDVELGIHFKTERMPKQYIRISYQSFAENFSLTVVWYNHYINSLRDSELSVSMNRHSLYEKDEFSDSMKYNFDIELYSKKAIWKELSDSPQTYSSSDLGEKWVKKFSEMLTKIQIEANNR